MSVVPRHLFIPTARRKNAYDDTPLPIGWKQTISQPYIVAYMTAQLEIGKDDRVLEIGTGSGYQAAILSELAGEVQTIERVEALYKKACRLLSDLEYTNVQCHLGDGAAGLPGFGAFNAIVVTAAAPIVPATLLEQLKDGGRMILPLGRPLGFQELVLIRRDREAFKQKSLLGVRFVPMKGAIEQHG